MTKENKKKKLYLASPFFCSEEIERVAYFEKLLRSKGFDVFSPREHQRDDLELFSPEWREAVYLSDMKNLLDSDYVFAIYDNKDPGTCFEVGAGIVTDKFTFVFTEKHDGINLMLADSAHVFFKSREEAENYDWENLPTNYWKGAPR